MILKTDFIYSLVDLKKYLSSKKWDISKSELLREKENNFGFSLIIPKYYADLINWYDKNDPLAKMVLISKLENNNKSEELVDPIGDKKYSVVPGVIHRYKDRCLLMLTNTCFVHCRFCFRRNILHENKADVKKSLNYISEHKEIREVIFSGGDAFILTDYSLEKTISELKKIPHVKILRFHTRTPVVYPKRVNQKLVNILTKYSPAIVVVHINHAREISEGFKRAINLMKKAGIMLLSQSVLLKGVNDNAKTLKELFYKLVETGVKPYYLHHPDLVKGTGHFYLTLEKGKTIINQLKSSISGVCIPDYVIELTKAQKKASVLSIDL